MNLTGQCLLATPQMSHDDFKDSVVFIVEDSYDGVMGILINKKSDCKTQDFFRKLKLKSLTLSQEKINSTLIHYGGPIQQGHGFVLHPTKERNNWETTIHKNPNISVTVSKDIIKSIACETGPKNYLIAMGCAGWERAQLKEELDENLWLIAPPIPNIIFNTDIDLRHKQTAESIGIAKISQLTAKIGNA